MEKKAAANKALPLGITDFAGLMESKQIYVDKTADIFELADTTAFYFMSRPRRFGKSLLVSTFHSLFENGLRDFKGLAIENMWDARSAENTGCLVFHFDFSSADLSSSSPEQFQETFHQKLANFMDANPVEQGIGVKTTDKTIVKFDAWLEKRAKLNPKKLVVLIDEYDAPLNRYLGDKDNFDKIRDILAAFYNTLKAHAGALRFMFITGICRFRHTTIFSGFNNLEDITMRKSYGTLLGYTEDELRHYFSPYIERSARALGISYEECVAKMKERYDGFCFDSHAATHVFTPWSVLKFFGNLDDGFANYWFETAGRPTVLMNYIKGHALRDPEEYAQDHRISIDNLNSAKELKDLDDIALLTQAGYLSIKEIVRGKSCIVNYPNLEIAESMATLYADQHVGDELQDSFADLFLKYDESSFVDGLNAFVGQLSYEVFPLKDERSMQATIYLCLMAVGTDPEIEVRNAWGRSDLEVKVKDRYFVLELKYAREGDNTDSLLDEAISQIKGKHYGEYSFPELKHIRLALVFSGKERQFVRYSSLDD